MNVIPFPPHANLVAHGMPVCRLGSGGKSSKFKMALSKKQLLLLVLHVVIAKSTKKTSKYLKKFWVRPIFQTRAQLSEIFTLVKELREEDHEGYFNYFRMLPNQFAGLFTQFGKATNLEVQ
jgi:hypothetical protein